MITLYSKDGQVKVEKIKKFSYSGKFMGECFLTANFASSDILNFDIGDYVMFRGEKFVLNYIPAKKKQASKGVYGKAFEYDSVKFNSLADELTRIEFIDVVKYNNNITYSSQPTFSFYASSVHDLVDRIQANLDLEFKGDERWAIVVSEDVVSTSKNISVSNISVADAVVLINTEFGLNFTFKNRTLTIGESGLAVGEVFAYGKDNGLFDIQQTTNQDAKIITRLRAFGSTRNIPIRYYNNLKDEQGKPYILESDDIKNLMLPSFPYEESDPRKLYLDSDNIEKYGVRYGSVYFDSEENEIYPSIKGMTKKQLNLSNINVSLPKDDNGNLDEVLGADNPTDDGLIPDEVLGADNPTDDGLIPDEVLGADNPTDDGLIPDEGKGKIDGQFKIYLKDIGFDLTEKDKDGQYKYQIAGQPVQIAMKSGMCVGREFDVVENGIKKDTSLGYTRYVLELKRFEDDQIKGGTAFPNNIYTIDKGDKFVILGIGMSDVYVKSASQKLLVAAQEYLSQNDETKYSYQPTISSNFMARNPHLGESIKEGDIFTFKDDDLQIDASEIIQTLNIEYNLDASPLPTYKVVLSNDKIASRLDKMQNSINTLVSNGTGITINQVKSLINTIGASMFLRKDIPDKTDYLLKFNKGATFGNYKNNKGAYINEEGKADFQEVKTEKADIKDLVAIKAKATDLEAIEADIEKATINDLVAQLAKIHNLSVTDTANILRAVVGSISSEQFKSGFAGEGFRIYEALNGDWNLEIDNVIVRKVFSVFELIVQKITHQGGMVINSPNGAKITKVTDGGSYWKCEHDSATDFFKDDQILCQNFTGNNIKRYWRLATNAGKGYVNLSKTDQEANSAIPQENDEIVVLGNRTNINRQSAIIVSTIGDNAPYTAYLSKINSYSLVGKESTRTGNLNGIVDKDFGALKGNGLFSENVYLKGIFKLTNGKSVERVIEDSSNSLTNSIQATKSELNASISKAEQTALLAQKSVDELEIGGRNLVVKSEAQYGLPRYVWSEEYYLSDELEVGQNYTFSLDFLSDGDLNSLSLRQYSNASLGNRQDIPLSGKNKVTFTVTKPNLILFRIYKPNGTDVTFDIGRIKIEKGTIATDWSPAPEDVQSQITKSKEEAEVAAKAYAEAQDSLKQIESKAYADDRVTEEEKRAIADAKAKLDAAKAYTDAQDEALKVKTDAYADGKITAEEKRAIADANAKLATAKKYAEAQDNLLKTQQEAYADGKVTEAEKRAIDDAANKVNAAKSELNASISKAEQTALLAQKSVDELEIGGRNYLLNTDFNVANIIPWDEAEYSLDGDILTIKPKNGARFAVGFPISKSIPIGEIVTLTFDYSLNIKPIYNYINITTNQAEAAGQISLGSFKKYDGSWDKLTIKFKVPNNTYKVLYIGWQDSSKDAVLKLKSRNISVQSGKHIDWSPAPEDVQSQIAKSKEEAEAAAKAYAEAQDSLKQIESKAYADDRVTEEEKRAIADAKAKLDASKAYADAQDTLLKTQQEAYADGKITAEEQRAIEDAKAKLEAAKKYAEAQDNLLKTQQEAYADGKVTEAEKRAIDDATNKVNATKSELNASISKAEQTALLAQKSVDELEIGGRNYLLNTDINIEKIIPWNKADYTLDDNILTIKPNYGLRFAVGFPISKSIPIGEIVTLTFDYSLNIKPIYNYINITTNQAEAAGQISLGSFKKYDGSWDRLSIRFKVPDRSYKVLYIGWQSDNKEAVMKIRNKSVSVQTHKPTDWTPAPEDLENQISGVETSITKEITKVRHDFDITEGQISGKITETTQLVNEAKTTSGETKQTLESTTARVNEFNLTAKKFEGTLGEITKKQGEVEGSILAVQATAKGLEASVNGFKETEREIKDTATRIEATHQGIVLEASEKSAQKAIDGVKIGGVNLIPNSANPVFYNNGSEQIVNFSPIKKGVRMTLAKGVGANTFTSYFIKDKFAQAYIITCNIATYDCAITMYNGWVREDNGETYIPANSKIRAISRGGFDSNNARVLGFYARYEGTKIGDYLDLTDYMLELGNKPSLSWSPAPEDYDAKFTETNASLKVLNDKIASEVSKTNGIRTDLTTLSQSHNGFKAQVKSDISGAIGSNNEVIKSSFEMNGNKIGLLGSEIDITGKVTFTALNSESQNKINTANSTASTALSNANNAQSSANNANSSLTSLKSSLGDLAYAEKVEKAQLGTTVIEGGFIKTELIKTDELVSKKVKTANSGPRFEMEGSEMKVYGDGVHPNMIFGVNEAGYAVMAYYTPAGNKLYDLGPSGINMLNFAPVKWTEKRLKQFSTEKSRENIPWYHFDKIRNGNDTQTNSPIYYNYYAGGSPTVSQEERERERYTYASINGPKIADGWYYTPPPANDRGYMQYPSNNSGNFIKPEAGGLYNDSYGVVDRSNIYIVKCHLYLGGILTDSANYYFQENPKK